MSFVVTDRQRRALLLWTGVKLSKDGKSVFNYNPGHFQAGLNFLLALPFLPAFLNRAHFLQLLALFFVLEVYCFVVSDATVDGKGLLDKQIEWCYANIAGLSRFVLGLFVSLVLSKTYYANRGVFGTVFGSSMGLTEMVVSWVRPPLEHRANASAMDSAKKAQEMIVRWINAAFRLMWLETLPGYGIEKMREEMLNKGLLTKSEWEKIEKLSSRCTHIYQWVNNVLTDLFEHRYIANGAQLVTMCKQVNEMRGANVWGLPSLPLPYTQIITHMVKMHVLMLACNNGMLAGEQFAKINASGLDGHQLGVLIILHLDLAFHHYLYQGLLDLHGALYNPNAGIFLGHMPSLNFMDFVRDVTEHLVSENDSLPYSLELPDLSKTAEVNEHRTNI